MEGADTVTLFSSARTKRWSLPTFKSGFLALCTPHLSLECLEFREKWRAHKSFKPVSQSVSYFTVPPRAHPSTGSQSGSATLPV